jgi:hypothetical protein
MEEAEVGSCAAGLTTAGLATAGLAANVGGRTRRLLLLLRGRGVLLPVARAAANGGDDVLGNGGGDGVTVAAHVMRPQMISPLGQHATIRAVHIREQNSKLARQAVKEEISEEGRILLATRTLLEHGGQKLRRPLIPQGRMGKQLLHLLIRREGVSLKQAATELIVGVHR